MEKFVGVGTICAYPKLAPVPFLERDLWNGYPEETNAPYGIAKKMLLVQGQAYRQEYGFNAIHLLPVNLYGPHDNFDPTVVARDSGADPQVRRGGRGAAPAEVVCWGTGNATREFLFVEDCAEAIVLAAERYDEPEPVNIGAGFEISIRDLAELIAELTGFTGTSGLRSAPNPTASRGGCLDVTRARNSFGFAATTDFRAGLARTIDWYQADRRLDGVKTLLLQSVVLARSGRDGSAAHRAGRGSGQPLRLRGDGGRRTRVARVARATPDRAAAGQRARTHNGVDIRRANGTASARRPIRGPRLATT